MEKEQAKDYIEDTLKIRKVSVRELRDRVVESRLKQLEKEIKELKNVTKSSEECLKEPDSIKGHQWRTYTLHELGMWVHLFVKRALHRADKIKARKDITNAQNYLNMMQSHIDTVRKQIS